MAEPEDVKRYLRNLDITFKEYFHQAVFTCEQASKERSYDEIKGVHSKNLFLKARKSGRFFLIILPFNKKLDIKALEAKLGEKVIFASQDELKQVLGVDRGAVSPFSLLNDSGTVELLIDSAVQDSEFVSFHPNVNTETLELSGEGFRKYLNSLKNKVTASDF